jgi:L-2-hydroxyglutarate oxidase
LSCKKDTIIRVARPEFVPSRLHFEAMIYDIGIVGGGIVGAATLYQMQKRYPHLKCLLIEKENRLAAHQTGHNSGVLHSGLYYKPGSMKAKNCREGLKEIVAFSKEYSVKHEVCGKVVAAAEEWELSEMEKIYQIGLENEMPGLRKLTADEVKEIEPYVEAVGGLFVASTGIIDYVGATEKMVEVGLAQNADSRLVLSEEVKGVYHESDYEILKTNKASYKVKNTIFCAGLQADRVAKMDGVKVKERVVGFRGDYYKLADHAKHKVKNLVYPVPNPAFPFLGVHFTRMYNNDVEAGPNAVFTFKREGYGKTDFNLRDAWNAGTYVGTWKMFLNNLGFAYNEYHRAFSKKRFLKTLQRLIPSLELDDLIPGGSGVRALLLRPDGDTKDDFRIEYRKGSIHVLNAPSPAATASLAIGRYIVEMAEEKFNLKERQIA